MTAAEALAAAECGDVLAALGQAAGGDSGDPMRAEITERGRSLSGGQRQRLALARSLVTDPEVLVLDEPTSAVDSHTESRIAAGLRKLRAGRTTVVFTTSPLLLELADQVLFAPEGTVVASGEHRELLRGHAGYRAVVSREDDAAPSPAVPGAADGVEPVEGGVQAEGVVRVEGVVPVEPADRPGRSGGAGSMATVRGAGGERMEESG